MMVVSASQSNFYYLNESVLSFLANTCICTLGHPGTKVLYKFVMPHHQRGCLCTILTLMRCRNLVPGHANVCFFQFDGSVVPLDIMHIHILYTIILGGLFPVRFYSKLRSHIYALTLVIYNTSKCVNRLLCPW